MTRLIRDGDDFTLGAEAYELAAMILDMPGADDRERLLVAAIAIVKLAGWRYGVDELRLAHKLAGHLALALVEGADAADEVPS
jgi:hypothetical protein